MAHRMRWLLVLLVAARLANAQTASEVEDKDVHRAYYAIKKITQADYDSDPDWLSALPQERIAQSQYEVGITCGDLPSAHFLGYGGEWKDMGKVARLMDLAGEIVRYKGDLHQLGYPDPLWRPLLVAYEEEQVLTIGSGFDEPANAINGFREARPTFWEVYDKHANVFEQRIASTLNGYRRRQNPSLMKIVVRDKETCAESDSARRIAIRIAPPDGQALFVPAFLYRYCGALGLNPDDPKICDYWLSAVDRVLYEPNEFRYWVRWPDGVEKRGILRSAGESRQDAVVTFSKP